MLAYLCLAVSIEDVNDRAKAALAANAMVSGRVYFVGHPGSPSAVSHVHVNLLNH